MGSPTWPLKFTSTLITLKRLVNNSVTWLALFRNLIQQLVPNTLVNNRGHQAVLFACGGAAYNWGLARVSRKLFVPDSHSEQRNQMG